MCRSRYCAAISANVGSAAAARCVGDVAWRRAAETRPRRRRGVPRTGRTTVGIRGSARRASALRRLHMDALVALEVQSNLSGGLLRIIGEKAAKSAAHEGIGYRRTLRLSARVPGMGLNSARPLP